MQSMYEKDKTEQTAVQFKCSVSLVLNFQLVKSTLWVPTLSSALLCWPAVSVSSSSVTPWLTVLFFETLRSRSTDGSPEALFDEFKYA